MRLPEADVEELVEETMSGLLQAPAPVKKLVPRFTPIAVGRKPRVSPSRTSTCAQPLVAPQRNSTPSLAILPAMALATGSRPSPRRHANPLAVALVRVACALASSLALQPTPVAAPAAVTPRTSCSRGALNPVGASPASVISTASPSSPTWVSESVRSTLPFAVEVVAHDRGAHRRPLRFDLDLRDAVAARVGRHGGRVPVVHPAHERDGASDDLVDAARRGGGTAEAQRPVGTEGDVGGTRHDRIVRGVQDGKRRLGVVHREVARLGAGDVRVPVATRRARGLERDPRGLRAFTFARSVPQPGAAMTPFSCTFLKSPQARQRAATRVPCRPDFTLACAGSQLPSMPIARLASDTAWRPPAGATSTVAPSGKRKRPSGHGAGPAAAGTVSDRRRRSAIASGAGNGMRVCA